MTSAPASPKTLWIKSPFVDLLFFDFGWVLIPLLFLFLNHFFKGFEWRFWVAGSVLFVSALHRHLTFPLVYGDPDKFQQRSKAYIVLPFVFLILTWFAVLHIQPVVLETAPLPQPIHFSSTDRQEFRFSENKKVAALAVSFSGEEKNIEEVAATLQRGLQGRVQVTSRGDRLRFQLPDAKDGDWLRFGASLGSKDLAQRLGVAGGAQRAAATRSWFAFMVVGAGLWCLYHSLMQKIGILRIYSRKSGYGKAWIDKSLIFSWFSFVLLAIGSSQTLLHRVASMAKLGNFLLATLGQVSFILPYFSGAALAVSLVLTFLYLRLEIGHPDGFNWPRNLFMLGFLLLFSTFFYDILAGFLSFAFNHAVEYLAFVYIFSKKNYLPKAKSSSAMARWVRRDRLYFGTYVLACGIVFIPWYFVSRMTIEWYIVGGSFLHFIYDGWIWKVRDPKVGAALGIEYGKPVSVSA